MMCTSSTSIISASSYDPYPYHRSLHLLLCPPLPLRVLPTKIKENARQMWKHTIPLVQYGTDTIDETAKMLSPIASMKYVHERNERKRKLEVVDPNLKKMGADLQMVAHHVREEKTRKSRQEAMKSGKPVEVSPPKKKSRRSIRHVVNPTASTEEEEKEKGYPLPAPDGGEGKV